VSRRTIIRHQPIADGLRALPRQWGTVGEYPARYSATSVARDIRLGTLPAYQPAGAFEAEVRAGADGEPIVHARYIGDPEVTA
jgi:hypothetical protein